MPAAHPPALAWRVVFRVLTLGQSVDVVCSREHGLDVSRHYVGDVVQRFEATGDVVTYQGQRRDTASRRIFTRAEDWDIVRLVVGSPRAELKDQHAQFELDTGVVVSYSAFCGAVRRLGFTRKKIRRIAYRCDRDRARAWLRELLTFHSVDELGVLDETSKDLGVLHGAFGYSLRGTLCVSQDEMLDHRKTRVSALCLYTIYGGFLDWALTEGTFTKEYFNHVTTENFDDWRGNLRGPMLTSHIDAARRKCCCILLDNATIHHSHEFVSRVVQHRAVVRYIPPYCWFLSPLDNGAFGALVRWLRQNYYYVQRIGIKEALEVGMRALNADGGRLARHSFSLCEYI